MFGIMVKYIIKQKKLQISVQKLLNQKGLKNYNQSPLKS